MDVQSLTISHPPNAAEGTKDFFSSLGFSVNLLFLSILISQQQQPLIIIVPSKSQISKEGHCSQLKCQVGRYTDTMSSFHCVIKPERS